MVKYSLSITSLTCLLMYCWSFSIVFFVFFFNDTATTEIYTLSLHDALPISPRTQISRDAVEAAFHLARAPWRDRKSTRLNSSHITISYAVFCLKKKKDHVRSSKPDLPSPAKHAALLLRSQPRRQTRHPRHLGRRRAQRNVYLRRARNLRGHLRSPLHHPHHAADELAPCPTRALGHPGDSLR